MVNTLNVSRWQGTGDSVAPLGSLADITDASYDYHEPRSSLVRGTPQPAVVSSRLGESVVGGGGGVGDDGLSGSHWYLCQVGLQHPPVFFILHPWTLGLPLIFLSVRIPELAQVLHLKGKDLWFTYSSHATSDSSSKAQLQRV